MSDKMECPGCGSYTSSVLGAVERGDPCPYCGLSPDAIMEIHAVRKSKADEALIRKTEDAIKLAAQQEAEIRSARRFMRAIRDALVEYESGYTDD